MDLFILKEIAKFDRSVWRLFSLLNKEMNKYFNVLSYEYELCFRTIVKDKYGIYYRLGGLYHRTDGPAIVYHDGSEYWWSNGNLHRLDGPAVIRINYFNEWYKNGKRHRLDGPAFEYTREGMERFGKWYIDGEMIVKE